MAGNEQRACRTRRRAPPPHPGLRRAWLPARALGLLGQAAALLGCATLPEDPVERALYADVRQIVDTRQRIGWIIDRSEYQDASASVLQSACQVAEERRLDLLDWLDQRIADEGGPAELAYQRAARDLDAIDELLTLERMRGALEYAEERAADDCPFWLEPDPDFGGVQTDTDRFVLLAESFGGLALVLRNGVLLGGGGALRLLPGYGVTDRVTLAAGVELGGSGAVSGIGTSDTQKLEARPTGALPLLLRIHDDTWLYDVELAALTQYHDGALTMPPGVRAALAGGIGAVRIGSLMPVALGFVAYELQPPFRDLPLSHTIRIGTRVGVDYDP